MEYNEDLRGKVPIAGAYKDNGTPIVELGVIQTVPEGTVILDETPSVDKERDRIGRVGLSPDEARTVAKTLNEMANRMEDNGE
jgi:hypothetical protein